LFSATCTATREEIISHFGVYWGEVEGGGLKERGLEALRGVIVGIEGRVW
jgi:hypothetical protein